MVNKSVFPINHDELDVQINHSDQSNIANHNKIGSCGKRTQAFPITAFHDKP